MKRKFFFIHFSVCICPDIRTKATGSEPASELIFKLKILIYMCENQLIVVLPVIEKEFVHRKIKKRKKKMATYLHTRKNRAVFDLTEEKVDSFKKKKNCIFNCHTDALTYKDNDDNDNESWKNGTWRDGISTTLNCIFHQKFFHSITTDKVDILNAKSADNLCMPKFLFRAAKQLMKNCVYNRKAFISFDFYQQIKNKIMNISK